MFVQIYILYLSSLLLPLCSGLTGRTKKAFQSTRPGLRKQVRGELGGFKNSPRVKGWEHYGLLSRLTAYTPVHVVGRRLCQEWGAGPTGIQTLAGGGQEAGERMGLTPSCPVCQGLLNSAPLPYSHCHQTRTSHFPAYCGF